MIIRKAIQSDIESLVELRFAYLNYHFGEINDGQKMALSKQLPDYFRNHLNRDCIAYIAETEEKIISTAYLIINEKPANPNFITGKTGLFLNVYTHPDYRRQGIATNILNELIKEARNLNLSFIELSATLDGKPVYSKLGFIEKTSDSTKMRLTL
jgi:GNAT superfamily N-acetyltransferase